MDTDREVQVLGAAMWKAREPNDSLCCGTESSWVVDESFVGLWCCKRSARYRGQRVSVALWVRVPRPAVTSQWSYSVRMSIRKSRSTSCLFLAGRVSASSHQSTENLLHGTLT